MRSYTNLDWLPAVLRQQTSPGASLPVGNDTLLLVVRRQGALAFVTPQAIEMDD